jgi:hypothetical protein
VNDPITDMKFWAQIAGDLRVVTAVACSPENESRVKMHLGVRGYDHIQVHVTKFVDDQTIYVFKSPLGLPIIEPEAGQ